MIRSLATLSLSPYRSDYFRGELLAALKVLQDGHIAREKMIGSWAGAMGQPQFMPSNFDTLAVDFTGDGRKDIWQRAGRAGIDRELLKHWGWKRSVWLRGHPSAGLDYTRSRATYPKGGARREALRRRPAHRRQRDPVLPSGASGPAFSAAKTSR